MKHWKFLFAAALLIIGVKTLSANNGDTTTVRSHNATHWSWYGSADNWAVFPDTTHHYRKITLKYKLGCPSGGCSAWDYTTQIIILRHTGRWDSTLTHPPHFTVDGNALDSVFFNTGATYTHFFDTASSATDSTINTQMQIIVFGDSLNPTTPTDTLLVYPGNYYNYVYDNAGNITDSTWVGSDSLWHNGQWNLYTPFEIIDPIEVGRYITPYGGNLTASFNNTWEFDVTDYAPLLHDSVEVRAFYSGWSDGFTITLDWEMIEGTPPRTPLRVDNLWTGYFPYGDPNNTIENYLVPRSMYIASNETMSEVKVDITGHGFGGNEDCAEFCPKNLYLKSDNTLRYQKLVWRDNCGMNSHYPQPGTWLYDRANWCPGDRVYPYHFELTPFVTPGDSVLIDMDMQSFVNVGNSNTGYQVDGQLITYSQPNFTLDAELVSIVAPNSNYNTKRFNPICNSPIIIIRNTGATPLTSLTVTYGVTGAATSSYTWNGNLNFLESDTVYLPTLNWFGTSPEFTATISNPNGNADQYADNNSLTVPYVAPVEYQGDLIFECKTNNAGWETSYQLTDASGNVIFSRSNLAGATIYRDTVHLVQGCYSFRMIDSGKDGLYFWANNSGSGYMRIKKINGNLLKNYGNDFGTEIYQEFTVGYNIGMEETASPEMMEVYPNPTSGQFTVDFETAAPEAELVVLDYTGRIVRNEKIATGGTLNSVNIDLSGNAPGLYIVQLRTQEGVMMKRIVLQ